MSPALVYEPHHVEADINYWPVDVDELGINLKKRYLGVPDEFTRKMVIQDIRGREDEFTWEQQGFQFVRLPKKERHEFDMQWAKEHFYPEIEEALKKITGGDHVHVVSHFCRAAPETIAKHLPDFENPLMNGPSAQAHVDYCADDGLMNVVRDMVLEDLDASGHPFAPRLRAARRWAIFNGWKPVGGPVERDPLALADCRTVPDRDYRIKKREHAPGVFGGSYNMAHSAAEDEHRWYYLHRQTPEEVTFFRNYDSDRSTPGYRTPHTAFRLPGMEKLPARESIECRGYVVWE